MELTTAQKQALVAVLAPYFAGKADFERAIVDLEKKAQGRAANDPPKISMTKWLRGLMAVRGIDAPKWKGGELSRAQYEEDKNYFLNLQSEQEATRRVTRDLSTAATPGSYLVPTIQANEIIALLADYGVLRRAGVRIVPMVGIEKMTMPAALAYPTTEWIGENTAQAASDANLGQVSFDLKTCRSLTPIPNELLASSVPAIDAIMAEIMAIGVAEAEDLAFFGTSSVANGPASLYSQVSNLTSLLAGGNNISGGTLTYQDILATMAASRKAKARGPFVWFCNPGTLYSKIAGLLDKNSRPIFDANVVVQKLFGWPIFDTVWIQEDQSNASGSNQSYLVLTNPKYIMIGEPGSLEIAVSTEFYFDKNQIAVRSVKRSDFALAPLKGITVLKGIN